VTKALRRARKAAKSPFNSNHQPRESTVFRKSLGAIGLAAALVTTLAGDAAAQTPCAFRGSLDESYCDADRNMVADVPADAARQRDPSTLVFAYTPVEDPALYAT